MAASRGSWIIDETRSVDDYTGYPSIKQGVLAELPDIELDPWRGRAPVILTESRSLAGVLRSVVSEYRARIASTNGQGGGFLHTDIAPLLQPGDAVGYLGDLDLAGGQIEANTRRVLERKIGGELHWERIALTATAGRAIRPADHHQARQTLQGWSLARGGRDRSNRPSAC